MREGFSYRANLASNKTKSMKGCCRLALVVCLIASGTGIVPTVQSSRTATLQNYDLVITNARIIDGSGNPWFRADVAIKDGRIARIGRVAPSEAAQTIDAKGQILAPGFIDVHTHVESIYNQPTADNFVRMGVTSLVTGNCGGSATNVGEFLYRIKQTPLSVNIATLIGHNSVRRTAMGLDDRAPTPEETQKMEALVEQAMKDGAVGLS